jgi:hypothetical protein
VRREHVAKPRRDARGAHGFGDTLGNIVGAAAARLELDLGLKH